VTTRSGADLTCDGRAAASLITLNRAPDAGQIDHPLGD